MAASRSPGPLGVSDETRNLNDGTMARTLAPSPGLIGRQKANSLQMSVLSPPLKEMKIRWDGIRPAAGGMQTLDSPRFGMTRNGGTWPHQGIDLAAAPGTSIYAIADGVIEQVRLNDPYYGVDILLKFRPALAWGQHLSRRGVTDDDGILYAQYAHLTSVLVRNGQRVSRGQRLGVTGTSGNADQRYPHLHFEVRKVRWPGKGQLGLSSRVNPELLFTVNFIEPYNALEKLSRTA